MARKLISVIMILACLFMLFAGALGIRDILQEKSDGEKEKAETLEKLSGSNDREASLSWSFSSASRRSGYLLPSSV